MRNFLFLFVVLAATACSYDPNADQLAIDKKIKATIKKNGWKMKKTSSGLFIEIAEKGSGTEKAVFTSQVTLNYKGSLLNGQIVDQTPPGKPFVSIVKGLIAGFQESLLGQTAGTKIHLIIPPNLAYGDEDLDKIPPNSTLVFELELVEVH